MSARANRGWACASLPVHAIGVISPALHSLWGCGRPTPSTP